MFSPTGADGNARPLGCAKFHFNCHRGWECDPTNENVDAVVDLYKHCNNDMLKGELT